MFYYLFSGTGTCLGICDSRPDEADIRKNGGFVIGAGEEYRDFENCSVSDGKLVYCRPEENPGKNINELFQDALAEIRKYREREENLPVEYNGNSFQADSVSVGRLTAAAMSGADIYWADAQNKTHLMTGEDFRAVLALVALRNDEIFRFCRQTGEIIHDVMLRYNSGSMAEQEAGDFIRETIRNRMEALL